MAFNEDSSASGHDEPWIQWFCGLKGHEMFCEVERSYVEDGFNLYGLRTCVSNFSDCLDLILDRIGPDDSDDSHLTQNACTLYGLIHARYIITAHGLDAMYNKYATKDFGTCPLLQCAGQPVLPVGLKDEIGTDTVKIFCPKCTCVYHPPPVRSRSNQHNNVGSSGNAGVDGASFGTTFPHLFLMTFSNLVPDPLPGGSSYIPRVFGFRVHQSARLAHSAAAASPTQMITIGREEDGKGRNGEENPSQGRSRNIDGEGNKRPHPPQFTTSKLYRIEHSSNKRSGRYPTTTLATVAPVAVNGKEGDDASEKKRKVETMKGDGEKNENGGIDSSSKRRKRTEKET